MRDEEVDFAERPRVDARMNDAAAQWQTVAERGGVAEDEARERERIGGANGRPDDASTRQEGAADPARIGRSDDPRRIPAAELRDQRIERLWRADLLHRNHVGVDATEHIGRPRDLRLERVAWLGEEVLQIERRDHERHAGS